MTDGDVADGGSDESGSALRADVGFWNAVAIEVGLIVGAGLFSLTGVATGIAGTAVFISYALAFGIVALSIVPTGVLGSAFPTTGGNYRYPSRLWSPHAAFLGAWGLAVSMLLGGLPVYARSFGEYVVAVIGVEPLAVGFVALTAFYLVNLVGIRIAAGVQMGLFLVLVASLVLFIVGGAPAVEPANLTPLFPTGLVGMATGAAILYFVCLGANFVVDIGDELTNAAVTIPRSFAVSVPLVAVLYILTGFVAVGTVGWRPLAGAELSLPAQTALSPGLAHVFIVGGALFAIATTINAVFMIAPKYLIVLAEDGLFPGIVARVNTRFGTAHWGLTLIYAISVAAFLSPLPLADLGALLGFGGILLIVPVMVAAVRFARDHPERYAAAPFSIDRRLLLVLATGAIVLNALLFVLLATEARLAFGVWLSLMVVGEGYYRARIRLGGGGARRDLSDLVVSDG